MEIIHKHQFFQMEYSAENALIQNTWCGENANITESEIKSTINLFARIILERKPKFVFSDETFRCFPYNVHIQHWVGNTIAKAAIEAGVQKYALIRPIDPLSDLTTEQVAEEVINPPFEIKYFRSKTDVMKWFGIYPNQLPL